MKIIKNIFIISLLSCYVYCIYLIFTKKNIKIVPQNNIDKPIQYINGIENELFLLLRANELLQNNK